MHVLSADNFNAEATQCLQGLQEKAFSQEV